MLHLAWLCNFCFCMNVRHFPLCLNTPQYSNHFRMFCTNDDWTCRVSIGRAFPEASCRSGRASTSASSVSGWNGLPAIRTTPSGHVRTRRSGRDASDGLERPASRVARWFTYFETKNSNLVKFRGPWNGKYGYIFWAWYISMHVYFYDIFFPRFGMFGQRKIWQPWSQGRRQTSSRAKDRGFKHIHMYVPTNRAGWSGSLLGEMAQNVAQPIFVQINTLLWKKLPRNFGCICNLQKIPKVNNLNQT
jgi:hypothetical protein